MFDLYAYDPENPFSTKLVPDPIGGDCFVTVQPISGVGVQSMLNIQVNAGVYKDHFLNVTEVVPGKGLYFPYYSLKRGQNFSQSQMDDNFSALNFASELRKYFFYFGIALGSFFVMLGLLFVAYRARIRMFGGWKSRGASHEFKRALSGQDRELKE